MYESISVLAGGRAGDGVNEAGILLARLLGRLGYHVYVENDYPSLIRGGHNFSVVRAAAQPVGARAGGLDVVIALTPETAERHRGELKPGGTLIVDAGRIKDAAAGGEAGEDVAVVGVDVDALLKAEGAPALMRNTCLLGAYARVSGIAWATVEETVCKHSPREQELNLRMARRGYDAAEQRAAVPPLDRAPLPALSGNEALALGLLRGGIQAMVAYPMTPTTGVLHFMARHRDDFGLTVVQPESELSVMLMALGMAYAGVRAAVCTSGGGFCLMTEGLSLSGGAELPVTVVLGQRPGPSTGLPTYTCQSDLHFALRAGHGEFPRVVVAPATPLEAYEWTPVAAGLSWAYQVPAIVLVDKTVCEGTYSTDPAAAMPLPAFEAPAWDGASTYRRYLRTAGGVSPLAFPPVPGGTVKVNSYAHDESGITTEDPHETVAMHDKRLGKLAALQREVDALDAVAVSGPADADTALLCWGSNGPVCEEAASALGFKVVRPRVLSPFPAARMRAALAGTRRTICVETNANGQLTDLLRLNGLEVGHTVLKYDGRAFRADDLERDLAEVPA